MSTVNPISGPPTRRDYLDLDAALTELKCCETCLRTAWMTMRKARQLLSEIEAAEKLDDGIDMQIEECEALRKWVQSQITEWDEREKRDA